MAIYIPQRSTKKILPILQDKLVAWCVGQRFCQMFDLDGNLLKVPERTQLLTVKTKLPWNSLCMVLCRSQLNEEYIKSLVVRSLVPETQPNLADALNREHQQLLEGVNPQHFINVGWVASPGGLEIPLPVASKIMLALGGWDCLAPWEKAYQEANRVSD